jgi:hypothetical protein
MAVSILLMSEKLEKRSGETPAAFPPPIFAGIASIFVFYVFPPPPLGNDEDVRHRRSEAQTSLGGATWA